MLTLHTTGDGLVVPQNEQAYAQVVRKAGRSRLLRQLFIDRAGHCAFTPAETIAAVQQLLSRMATGHWNNHALRPASMDTSAAALGAGDNIFFSGGKVASVPPAFIRFRPTRYPRPFDLSPRFHP